MHYRGVVKYRIQTNDEYQLHQAAQRMSLSVNAYARCVAITAARAANVQANATAIAKNSAVSRKGAK